MDGPDQPNGEVRVDEVDRRILALLRDDARLSARALGREIGMSASAVSERVQRLEAAGVIQGYRAVVDPAALGYAMRVLVGLQVDQGKPLEHTIEVLLAIPEVVEVDVVAGQWDLVVLAQVRDHHHLRDLVAGALWDVPGFRHSETILVLDRRRSDEAWTTGA